jgi:hypothetical protein
MESLCCDSGIIRFAKSSIACCEQSGWHSMSNRRTIPHLHPLPLAKGEARATFCLLSSPSVFRAIAPNAAVTQNLLRGDGAFSVSRSQIEPHCNTLTPNKSTTALARFRRNTVHCCAGSPRRIRPVADWHETAPLALKQMFLSSPTRSFAEMNDSSSLTPHQLRSWKPGSYAA